MQGRHERAGKRCIFGERVPGIVPCAGQLVRHGRGDLDRCLDELVDGGVEVVQITHLDTETGVPGFGKAFDAVFRWDGCVLGLPCTIRGMDSPVDLLPGIAGPRPDRVAECERVGQEPWRGDEEEACSNGRSGAPSPCGGHVTGEGRGVAGPHQYVLDCDSGQCGDEQDEGSELEGRAEHEEAKEEPSSCTPDADVTERVRPGGPFQCFDDAPDGHRLDADER